MTVDESARLVSSESRSIVMIAYDETTARTRSASFVSKNHGSRFRLIPGNDRHAATGETAAMIVSNSKGESIERSIDAQLVFAVFFRI